MEEGTSMPEIEEVMISTGGRPSKHWRGNGVLLNKVEYEKYQNAQKEVLKPKGMDAESFSEFCKLAAPNLVQRMYELATQSEDIRAIAIVAKELTDRAYGKSVQAVQVSVDSRVREAWNVIDIKEIEDETGKPSIGGDGEKPAITHDKVETRSFPVHRGCTTSDTTRMAEETTPSGGEREEGNPQ